jgi:hypothetical protein
MIQRIPVLSLSTVLVLAASPALAQQTVAVSAECSAEVANLLSDPRPEPEWDIVGMELAGTGCGMIVHNDDAADPARLARFRVLGKAIFSETIRDESGAPRTISGSLGQMILGGTLAGVELDMFDPQYDPTPAALVGTQAELRVQLVDASAGGAHVAYLYAYNAQQFAARKALLGASETTVWLGDMVHSADLSSRSMNISGHDNVFLGRVRSAGGLRIGGFEQRFDAPVYWANGPIKMSPIPSVTFAYMPQQEASPLQLPPPQTQAWFQAQPSSLFFLGDVTVLEDGNGNLIVSDGLQSWPAEGRIVCTLGSINVEGQTLAGSVTLIAIGDISISADSSLLRPAAGDCLAWSAAADVTIGGSANDLVGALRAGQHIRFSGSENSLTGQVRCNSFIVTGGENVLTDGAY